MERYVARRQSVATYLTGPETLTRRELVFGLLREPPAPACDHQSVVTRALLLLALHITPRQLGRVLVSPVDVVLDERKALILQPDVVYISRERSDIIRDRIWGAPDLAVEVLSPGTRRRDCRDKRRWYRHYGVREYWIVDPVSQSVEVLSFTTTGRAARKVFTDREPVASPLLPELAATAEDFFWY